MTENAICLTVAEAAASCKLTKHEIRKLCKAGKLDYFGTGKRFIISRESLETYLKERFKN